VLVVALAVLLASSAAVAGGAGSVAAGATTETTDESEPVKLVYVDGSTSRLTLVRADGTKVPTDASDASVVGPMADLDDDGLLEAPYVTSNGDLRAVDANNETQSLASGVATTSTKLAVGDWTGDGVPEVVYPDSNDDIHYANVSGEPTGVGTEAASAVLGVADFDGSGETDIVFVGTSQNLHYYDGTETVDTQYGSFGTSGAAGAPADFYGNGTLWVPAIDGSGYPEIVNSSGSVDQFRQNSNNTEKRPVAGVDWVEGGDLELVHLQNGELAYTHTNGTVGKIRDADGDTISATDAGVAGVESYPGALSVSEFEANATAGQNVTVNVTTNYDLASLNVTLGGPENATLALADFSETATDPYSYTATYDGSTDGEYTATLEEAASDGDSVSPETTDTATVDAVAPSLGSANVTDATDGNGVVAPGDVIEVTAIASGDVDSVTADLSAFDAGSVELAHESSDSYDATVEVGANATDGEQAVMVAASDGQGNTDSAETGNVTVDTDELAVSLRDGRTVEAGEEVEFSPESVDGAAGDVDYDWTFDDGDSASGKTVTHAFEDTGSYEVTLTGEDGSGDVDTASMSVDVTAGETNTGDTSDADGSIGTDSTTDDTGDSVVSDGGGVDSTTTEPTQATTERSTAEPTRTERATTAAGTGTTGSARTSEQSTAAADTTSDDNIPPQTPGEAPGFGVATALLALVGAAGLALRE